MANVTLAVDWNGFEINSKAEQNIKDQLSPHLGKGIPTIGVTKITIHILEWENGKYLAKLDYEGTGASDTLAGKL